MFKDDIVVLAAVNKSKSYIYSSLSSVFVFKNKIWLFNF